MNTSVLTRRLRRARRGMTLIEIIVVIAIISTLSAAVAISVYGHYAQSQVDTAAIDLKVISTGLDAYRFRHQSLRQTGDLKALVDSNILKTNLKDPWGNPYLYERTSASTAIIKSLGKDGLPGGEGFDADITLEHKN